MGVGPIYFMGLIKCCGGGGGWGCAKIFYGLENITRPANSMQLTCSMPEKSMIIPWFGVNISLLKSSKNLSYACRIGHICRFWSCSLIGHILSTFRLCYLDSWGFLPLESIDLTKLSTGLCAS